MNAMLVIKTANGYAVAPYVGDIPADFVQNMHVATKLNHSYQRDTIVRAMEDQFEPPEPLDNVTEIKGAA